MKKIVFFIVISLVAVKAFSSPFEGDGYLEPLFGVLVIVALVILFGIIKLISSIKIKK